MYLVCSPPPQMTMSSQPQNVASMASVITMGTTTIGSSTNTTNDLHPVFTQVANPFSAPSHNVPPMCLSPPPVCMQNPWELYQNYDHLGAAAPIYTMPAMYSTPLPPSTNYAGPQQDTSSSWLQLQGPQFVALFAMALRDPEIQELYNELGMTNKNCATKQELESCRAELELLKSSYCELKQEVEDLKQYTRRNALRISNPAWKDSNDEDTDERILNLCEEFKINVNRGDISRSHRVGKKETNKQRVLTHGHQGWNVRHGLCHICMIYVYVWVVYSFCLFCCLFIIVTTQFVALYKPCKPKPKPSTYDPPDNHPLAEIQRLILRPEPKQQICHQHANTDHFGK